MSTADDRQRSVLLVEDDAVLRSTLATILEDEGLAVEGHRTGEAALARLDEFDPDVAIVDLGLPGMSGLDVVAAVRQRSDIAVLILTARTDTSDIVAGLDAGADDFVTKPFVVGELLARIRAHLRRSAAGADDAVDLTIADLRIRQRTGEVTVRGEDVHLTRTELRVLLALAAVHGSVMTREQLLSQVWRYDYLGDSRMVDAQIRRIRLKIEADPSAPTILLTVRGAGYCLSDGSTISDA